MNEPHSREETIFHAALQLAADKRAAYLDLACERDESLRRRIEELLQAETEAAPFFRKQPLEVAMGTKPDEKATARSPRQEGAGGTALGPPRPLGGDDEKAGDRIDRYKLLQRLGEGGFGAVYMAEQKEPVKRRVALKIIKLGMDTKQVVARFEAERQALALMDHPNIAKVLDAGATESGRPYFVMELVRGVPITKYCDENNLAAVERLQLFIQVCRAIQHAHQKGVIHRDIKPSNILVTLHDGVPVPKVIDFGIAKATQQELTDKTVFTQFQQFIGTPAYISPEQAEMSGLDIDTRSDIYSLGVLLYELLTGQTPFDGKELLQSGLDEMRRTIREKEPVRPSTRLSQTLVAADVRRLKSSTPAKPESEEEIRASSRRLLRVQETISLLRGDLDWIVMKCLEKDRTRRYDTANSLASDIQRHLNSEPVEARPPSQFYRFQKLARRNKVAFTATAAVALALIVGLSVSTWQFIEKSKAYQQVLAAEREQSRLRQQAEANEQKAQQAQESEAQQRQLAEKQELMARQRAYASDMNLAQQALAVNNVGRALDLLDRHRPSTVTPSTLNSQLSTDLRGWEWRYLWQQRQNGTSVPVCQRTNSVLSLAVSHDGGWVAVGEIPSDSVSIWDLRRGQEIASLPAGKGAGVRAAFSPKELLLAFSFAIGVESSTNRQFGVRVWNGTTRKIVAEFALDGECNGLLFSDDGQRLLVCQASPGDPLSVWRVPEGTKLATYDGASGILRLASPLAATRDLSLAAYVTQGGGFDVVDLVAREKRWSFEREGGGPTRALAFSPDAKVLASGYVRESEIRLWDVASGKMICRREGAGKRVEALAFLPDGKTLASAGGDHAIRLWDLTDFTNVPPARILRRHRSEVWQLVLAPDGTTLVSGSADGSVYRWDTSIMPRELGPTILPERVWGWRFGSDNKSVLAVDKKGRVARWGGDDFQEMQPLLQVGTNITHGCFSVDGRWAAVGLSNGIVQVADLQKRKVAVEFQAHAGPVLPLQFLSEGKKLVIVHEDDRSLHEWDLTNRRWTRTLPGAPGPLRTPARPAAFSPDEQWCVTLGWNGASMLTDLITAHASSPNLDIKRPTDAAYFLDGKLFAAASFDGYVKLWETKAWREVTLPFRGFLGNLGSVAFSPDKKRLAIGGDLKEEALKLWNLDSQQEVLTLEGQAGFRSSTGFSPDSSVLGAKNVLGVLQLWRAPSWEEIEAEEKAQKKVVSQ